MHERWIPFFGLAACLALFLAAEPLAQAVLMIPLFHRAPVAGVLAARTRSMIYETVCSRPGLSVGAVARNCGVAHATAAYHLGRLEREGHIVLVRGRYASACYASGSGFLPEDRALLALLRTRATVVLAAILDEPGVSFGDLCRRTQASGPSVRWHLRKLASAKLVEERSEGRRVRLWPDPTAVLLIGGRLEPRIGAADEKLRHDLAMLMAHARRPNPGPLGS